MKVRVKKSVRFQDATLPNEPSKGEDWRELLPIAEEEEGVLSDNENDEREEWIPATSKVTVIQRDAPPELEEVNLNNDDEVIVETYLAVVKRNQNSDVGISFTRTDSNSPLCIDHITTHGPFSYSDLEAGMVVSAINGKYMTWSSPEDALVELEKDTTMKVTAEYAPDKYYCKEYTMTLEPNLEEFCGDYGVTFDRKGENLPLFVKDVEEDGPFADLLPGLKVIAIDGQLMAWESPETAQKALAAKLGVGKSITVEATTENVNTSVQHVAIEMQEESKEVMITEVETYTKHAPCDLREGMTVIMLNGQVCSEASSVDALMRGAGQTWDVIAVDLRCKRVLVNQDTSAGEKMLTFCGAGALGMAAVSLSTIDMCTNPLNNMLTQQNALEEDQEDGILGTRQLLLDEEETATRDAAGNSYMEENCTRDTTQSEDVQETATRDAAGSEDGVNEKDAWESDTQAASTVADSQPYEQTESECENNDIITIFSKNANDDFTEATSEQEDATTQVTSRSEATTSRSLFDTSFAESTDTASASPQDSFKPLKAAAPAAVPRSVPGFSTPPAESKKMSTAQSKSEPPKLLFNQKEERRTSFEFSLDRDKIEKAPNTMHSYKIQKISNEDVGLKLAAGQYGGIYIAEMKSHCKFRGTGVKSGMRIAKINGVDCPTSMRVTTSFINAVHGPLELVTTFGARPKETKKREIFFSGF